MQMGSDVEAGNYQTAIQRAQTIHLESDYPPNAFSFYHSTLGQAYTGVGDYAKARQHISRAISLTIEMNAPAADIATAYAILAVACKEEWRNTTPPNRTALTQAIDNINRAIQCAPSNRDLYEVRDELTAASK